MRRLIHDGWFRIYRIISYLHQCTAVTWLFEPSQWHILCYQILKIGLPSERHPGFFNDVLSHQYYYVFCHIPCSVPYSIVHSPAFVKQTLLHVICPFRHINFKSCSQISLHLFMFFSHKFLPCYHKTTPFHEADPKWILSDSVFILTPVCHKFYIIQYHFHTSPNFWFIDTLLIW